MKYASLRIVALTMTFAGDTVATVTVETENGPVRINASEYDPSKHTAVDPSEVPVPAPGAASQQPAPPPPAVPPSNVPPVTTPTPDGGVTPPQAPPTPPSEQPVEKFVTKTGKKWFVTDNNGKPLDPAHEGYATEAEAQAAVKA